MTQRTLKRIIVGSVLRVDVQIRLMLEMIAKIYNHHHCLSRRRPGKMIAIFVAKPQASTVLTLVQYERLLIVLMAFMIFLKNSISSFHSLVFLNLLIFVFSCKTNFYLERLERQSPDQRFAKNADRTHYPK